MRRVLLTAAACAFGALAVAGCEPPVEQSAYNNSGLSAAVAFDPSAAPKPPENPPPRIEPPAQQAATSAAPSGTKG